MVLKLYPAATSDIRLYVVLAQLSSSMVLQLNVGRGEGVEGQPRPIRKMSDLLAVE